MAAQNSGRSRKPPEGKRFTPGASGNPGGAPKGKRISTWMMELGQMTPDALTKIEPTLTVNGKIALARIRAAMTAEGDRSTDTILDRTEGKVPQGVELGAPGGGPVRFTLGLGDGQGK